MRSDFALNEAVQFIPTPGHTIDHYPVLVGHPGEDVLITGDMIHSPIQGRYPELGMPDYDSPQAGKTASKTRRIAEVERLERGEGEGPALSSGDRGEAEFESATVNPLRTPRGHRLALAADDPRFT
jgi:glyoxylase-like metal-dependent hydrolase (beta-lactamase superfamily II)